jgi:IS30 family transposase
MKAYTHFTLEDRESLEKLIKEGKNKTEIAKEMGRDRSSIYRELKRNTDKVWEYMPIRATMKYLRRRKRSRRKHRYETDKLLIRYTKLCLRKYWSPEIIVAKWKQHRPQEKLSHSTIYRALERKLIKGYSGYTHLRRRNKQKYVREDSAAIKPDYTIHDRPKELENRGRIGDFEGDTVRGGRGSKGALVTMVDRKSRYLMAGFTPNLKSETVLWVTTKLMKNTKVESLTLDNGSEFAKHRDLAKNLNTKIYFADPGAPHQRGSNENINDVLRFFYPKGCDFTTISNQELNTTLELINTRPRKCLGWLSPKDVFFSKCCT